MTSSRPGCETEISRNTSRLPETGTAPCDRRSSGCSRWAATLRLELEVDGSLVIRQRHPDACLIFVDAPLAELERRLVGRATEMSGEIAERLEVARSQAGARARFDHVVVNDDVERAANELFAILQSESAYPRAHFSSPRDP